VHGIRFACSHPIGASLAIELDGRWHLAIIYARDGEAALWESTRACGVGLEGERRAMHEASARNADFKRWLARGAPGAGGRDPGSAAG
jgi:hypothetical protein